MTPPEKESEVWPLIGRNIALKGSDWLTAATELPMWSSEARQWRDQVSDGAMTVTPGTRAH